MGNASRVAEVFVSLFFLAVIFSIVFVSAGAKGGMNGGQQSAQIIGATGTSLSSVASSLEQS